jgi:hypothetical protein
LYQQNKYIGLLDMDLLLMIDYILIGIVFLALWAKFHNTNPALVMLAMFFELLSITIYFSSSAAFEMLTLSDQYFMATTETDRTMVLSAGLAMISTWQGTAFNASYLLGCLGVLTISAGMLKSNGRIRATAWIGLVVGILMTVPPTAGKAGLVMSFLSLLPTLPWLILLANLFFRFAREGAADGEVAVK